MGLFTVSTEPLPDPKAKEIVDIDGLPSPTWKQFQRPTSTNCGSNVCLTDTPNDFPCSWHIYLEDRAKFCVYKGKVLFRDSLRFKLGHPFPVTEEPKRFSWRDQEPTSAQVSYATSLGLSRSVAEGMSKGEISDWISENK